MPSGKPITWELYDDLIRQHVPHMAISVFRRQHLPHISEKAIGARARDLGVKHGKFHMSPSQKSHASKIRLKETPELIEKVRSLRDSHSVKQIASICGITKTHVNRLIARHNIKLSQEGYKRARSASTVCNIGKTPWNKGLKLPDQMKVNMAIGRQKMSDRLSVLQSNFYRILDELQISYFKEWDAKCRFGHWTFDARIDHNGYDFLVEVQGDYIHSQPKTISKDRAKATYMERYFSNIPIKYIYEHEFGAINRAQQVIRQWVGLDQTSQRDFDFDRVQIRQIDENTASGFLATFHYLGRIAGRIRLGAYVDTALVAVSVWSAPARYETATRLGATSANCLELRRFVIHSAYQKKNFASWLLAKMEKRLPKSISTLVSFADPGVGHCGTIYKAANWQSDGRSESSYFYVDTDGYVMMKKTLFVLANKMHMKESQFAQTHQYTKVQTPPKLRFVKHRGARKIKNV